MPAASPVNLVYPFTVRNSGNSTEPHLHMQAMDSADPARASAVPISFAGGLPRNGTIVRA